MAASQFSSSWWRATTRGQLRLLSALLSKTGGVWRLASNCGSRPSCSMTSKVLTMSVRPAAGFHCKISFWVA